MFKIIPQNNENQILEYIKAVNTKRVEGAFVYAMLDYDTNELMAISQFEIGDKEAYVYDIKEANGEYDYEAMFILLRQTMNFIEKCGIDVCFAYESSGNTKLLCHAGFKKTDDNKYKAILTGMFDGHCQGH